MMDDDYCSSDFCEFVTGLQARLSGQQNDQEMSPARAADGEPREKGAGEKNATT